MTRAEKPRESFGVGRGSAHSDQTQAAARNCGHFHSISIANRANQYQSACLVSQNRLLWFRQESVELLQLMQWRDARLAEGRRFDRKWRRVEWRRSSSSGDRRADQACSSEESSRTPTGPITLADWKNFIRLKSNEADPLIRGLSGPSSGDGNLNQQIRRSSDAGWRCSFPTLVSLDSNFENDFFTSFLASSNTELCFRCSVGDERFLFSSQNARGALDVFEHKTREGQCICFWDIPFGEQCHPVKHSRPLDEYGSTGMDKYG